MDRPVLRHLMSLHDFLDLAPSLCVEVEVGSGQHSLDVLRAAYTDDGGGNRGIRKHPGDCQLGNGLAEPFRDAPQSFDLLEVTP